MASFVDGCGFIATSTGTVDFVVAGALLGYQTPASANAVNATVYKYRAQSADLTQWELGSGTYTVGSTTLSRTLVSANSSGTTAKINFTAAPQVFIVALSADIANLGTTNVFTDATDATSPTAGGTLRVGGGVASNGISYLNNLVVGPVARDPLLPTLQMANQVEHIGVGPTFTTKVTGGGTDQKFWDVIYAPTNIAFRAVNDAYNAATNWFQVIRGSGYTISNVVIPSALSIGGSITTTDTTDSTTTTTGSMIATGGIGVTKNVTSGQSFLAKGDIGSFATIDAGTVGYLMVSGATKQLANNCSGFVFLQDDGATGILAIIGIVNGQVVFPWQNAAVLVNSASPTTAQIGVYYDGVAGRYTIKNGFASSKTFYITTMRLRPFN